MRPFGIRRKRRDSATTDNQHQIIQHVPDHIAIIMDGNGRWAKARGLPRIAGHHSGMLAMREVVRACDDLGVKYLTLYSFSTENWKRPRQEIEYLWRLVDEFFALDIEELVERNVRITILGDTTELPAPTQATVNRALQLTASNSGLRLQFALNYGSRREIVEAVQAISEMTVLGNIKPEEINEKTFSDALATKGIPDPDLLIRTSGDQRISNFLLWQIAYTELYFVEEMWPEFKRRHLEDAIRAYNARERRYGGLK